jgi:hypothetical protein
VGARHFLVMVAAAGALALGDAHAQADPRPKHGGVMSRGDQDIYAELVAKGDGVALYVEAEEKAVGGSLRRLARARAPEEQVALTPAGENTLTANGLKLARGDQVRAYVRFANGREQTFAFTYWQ